MSPRSPLAALLWEQWRITRLEVAQRLAQGLIAGAAALLLLNDGAATAFWLLILTNGFFWFSIAKLNGGRFMDGYKPGFPLYLLYTRPVSTRAIVGVSMAYDALGGLALYLLSAAALVLALGQPIPMLEVSLLLVAFHCAYTCIQWSTRSRVVQWTGSIVVSLPMFFMLKDRAAVPAQLEFSAAEHAVMALVCIVAYALTVAGVAAQRRGDAMADMPRAARAGGFPVWLVDLVRLSCPTSSATRAQLWFELRSSGLPLLAIGLSSALLIGLLFAMSIPIAALRPFALVSVMMTPPAVLLFLGANAFGIRRRQGRAFMSTFEATQPLATTRLTTIKILVRATCLLLALVTIGAGSWAASALVGAWAPWVIEGKDAAAGVVAARESIGILLGNLGRLQIAGLTLASLAIALMVAALATFAAMRARYPRHVLVAFGVGAVNLSALVALAWAGKTGLISTALLANVLGIAGWVAMLGLAAASAYLLWQGTRQRVLTPAYVVATAALAVAFGAAWLAMPMVAEIRTAAPLALLAFVAGLLAPWSLGRLRHT